MGIDLFSYPKDREIKLHPDFKKIKSDLAHEPARKVLASIQKKFTDPDGNFVEQFQTNGFDARTFELFLFAMFDSESHFINRTFDRPDFILSKNNITVAVEAVTSNRSGGKSVPYSNFGPERSDEELIDYIQNELAIKIGSPLFSKLNKRYWELPQVKGKPLIIALECFHEDGSLSYSSAPIADYLYGTRHTWYHDASGKLIIVPRTISEHRLHDKKIPSGFFNQPNAEHISAVLFCNTGTIAKFNRMGQQNPATRSRFIHMFRIGAAYKNDANATMPVPFIYEVGDTNRIETWSEGTDLIHNPNALHPVPSGWLGSGIESRLQTNGKVVTTFSGDGFLPYWSQTTLIPFSASRKKINIFLQRQMEALQASMKNCQTTFK